MREKLTLQSGLRRRACVGLCRKFGLWALAALWCASSPAAASEFTNPIGGGADPFAVYHDGFYYSLVTTGWSVEIRRSVTLQNRSTGASQIVFSVSNNGPIYAHLWAPELHYLNGKWYIYATGSTDPGGGFQQRMFVLEGNTQGPMGTYTYRGLLEEHTGQLDASILTRDSDGAHFVLYSQWDDAGQSLYIAPMTNPWTMGSPRVRISVPSLAWERFGAPVNEGPIALKRGNKTMVIYSASGTWTPDYSLGMLVNTDGNYLNPGSWIKHSNPVFQRYNPNEVYCVGHNGFTTSPDGKEDWIVFHATSDPTGNQESKRFLRMERFYWNSNDTPNFDVPVRAGTPLAGPGEATDTPQPGLRGEYFNNRNLAGKPAVVSVNGTLDFDWGIGAPLFSINHDDFSVRWSGQINPEHSETYTFYATSDDGVRLWVNGQLLVNAWQTQGPTTRSGTIALTAGQLYEIRIEYFEATGGAMFRLEWSSQSQPREVISRHNLFSAGVFPEGVVRDDFSDGTLRGWQVASADGQGRQTFAIVPPSVNSPNTTPQSGAYFVGLQIPGSGGGYNQDSAHDTLVLRSPEFMLNGADYMSVWLAGGSAGSLSLAGTSVAALPSTTTAGGFRGIALRNVTTGTYVLSAAKTSNGDPWEEVYFSPSALAALPQGHTYTLDLIDAAHGSWGWVNMDTVAIPGTITEMTLLPTIGEIADQTIALNTSTGPIGFTVDHEQLDPGGLTLQGASSNNTLLPQENIVFGGEGTERTVTVTPAADQLGTATVTVTVGEGSFTASTSFQLMVATADMLPIDYDFGEGALGDWTMMLADGQGRQTFAIVPPSVNSPNTIPHSGSHFIGLQIPGFGGGYWQQSPHDTLLLRSPEFSLNGSGPLTVWLTGGGAGSASLAGTDVTALPAASSEGGFIGVAIRDVTTGVFVLSRTKASDGVGWQQVSFTTAELAALPQEHTYTLDLIDAGHGAWAWVNMDTVSIPGVLVESPDDETSVTLTIEPWTGNQVRLSWPVAAAGWTLQRASGLDGSYTDAGLEIQIEDDEQAAYDPIIAPRQFYRLVK